MQTKVLGAGIFNCLRQAGHSEVAPREFDVHPRWKPEREAEEEKEEEEEEEEEEEQEKETRTEP